MHGATVKIGLFLCYLMSLFQLHRDNIYMYVHGEILTANLLVWKKKEIAPVEVTMAYTGEMHRSSHS
jgi:hypothetical protein